MDDYHTQCHLKTSIVDSLNCCNPIKTNYSSNYLKKNNNDKVVLNQSTPKGIKLTKSNKTFNFQPIKIKQLRQLQSYSNNTTARKLYTQKQRKDKQQDNRNNMMRVNNTCREYKNLKVQELHNKTLKDYRIYKIIELDCKNHKGQGLYDNNLGQQRQQQINSNYTTYVPYKNNYYKKQSVLYSTRKHTHQTISNSMDYAIVENTKNTIPAYHMIEEIKAEPERQNSQIRQTKYMKQTKQIKQAKDIKEAKQVKEAKHIKGAKQAKKIKQIKQIKGNYTSLNNFYEQRGKKIYTIQSLMSQNESNDYSVVEACQFVKTFQNQSNKLNPI